MRTEMPSPERRVRLPVTNDHLEHRSTPDGNDKVTLHGKVDIP